MNANEKNTTPNSEAYNTGFEAHEQGEPRENVSKHYAAGTWDEAEFINGWDDAEHCDR